MKRNAQQKNTDRRFEKMLQFRASFPLLYIHDVIKKITA